LPTGFGKTLIAVLFPLILDEVNYNDTSWCKFIIGEKQLYTHFQQISPAVRHVAIIVSPLRALMSHQSKHCEQQGIKCAWIHPDLSEEELACGYILNPFPNSVCPPPQKKNPHNFYPFCIIDYSKLNQNISLQTFILSCSFCSFFFFHFR
jgi:hypothetical protein